MTLTPLQTWCAEQFATRPYVAPVLLPADDVEVQMWDARNTLQRARAMLAKNNLTLSDDMRMTLMDIVEEAQMALAANDVIGGM